MPIVSFDALTGDIFLLDKPCKLFLRIYLVTKHIDAIVSEVNRVDDPRKRKTPLPDDAIIARYETATGFEFSEDYKKFLKSISNAFMGYLSPLTLNEEMGDVYGK
ncbi:SMI1/KNR4 family protein [Agrobacterium pusense]|uniref:SMI1/KNR4 family protein n=1 Tax=Agrobacterium pusense TaxID=648995 RepID=UPI002351D011|nr:SMI1/KNR4 family protein [Agrobacterium pusense]